ncbi:DUF1131 family protein [Caulobacter sp. UNC358MFTsu5.1]|uniref:DUF1131 family protein n=1 Tax=Caulobacter sp. UNC358MFTsu5.1 TaxID=1449049 RepID=UPI0004A766B2|nr:DUF1131 family protein [Caulobacter sp. UNC358MFTsu5.1]
MTQRLALIAAPLLLLAACGPAKQADKAPPAASSAEVPKSGPVAVAVTPYVGGPLHVRADGVGPITGETAFDEATIKALFPKAVVKSAFIHTGEGPPGPILTLEQDNTPLLEIGKGAEGGIGEIRLAGGPVEGPKGEALLAKWGDLGFDIVQCRAGEGRTVNQAVCVRPEAPTVAYVFGVPGWTKGGLPPVEVLKAKGQLNEFVWRPAEQAAVGAA